MLPLQLAKDKSSVNSAEARLREELEEREADILAQVEETKKVERALALRDQEILAQKVRQSAAAVALLVLRATCLTLLTF